MKEKVVLKRSGQRPLEFVGELLTVYETSPDQARTNWSGAVGYWVEIKVYRTADGRYVLWKASYTQWQGERDVYTATVFATLDELIKHLEETTPKAAAVIAEELGVHEVCT